MNQGIFTLIVTLLFISGIHCTAFSNSNDSGDLIMQLNNAPGADDVDEANSLSSEFKSRYSANRGDETRRDIVYYLNPKRNSITFIFYGLTDENVQDLICKIINNIRIERQLMKTILIQFNRTENIVQDLDNPRVQRREKEELLRSVTLK
jgi:hypothetical protein